MRINVGISSSVSFCETETRILLMINVKPDNTHVNSDIQCNDW